jgi:hypothetical protein
MPTVDDPNEVEFVEIRVRLYKSGMLSVGCTRMDEPNVIIAALHNAIDAVRNSRRPRPEGLVVPAKDVVIG